MHSRALLACASRCLSAVLNIHASPQGRTDSLLNTRSVHMLLQAALDAGITLTRSSPEQKNCSTRMGILAMLVTKQVSLVDLTVIWIKASV